MRRHQLPVVRTRRCHRPLHSIEIDPHQSESEGGAEVPLEVVPGAPVYVAAHVYAFIHALLNFMQIGIDSGDSAVLIVGADPILGDDDRLTVAPMKTAQNTAEAVGAVAPHLVMRHAHGGQPARALYLRHRQRIEQHVSVIAQAPKIDTLEGPGGFGQKPPIH